MALLQPMFIWLWNRDKRAESITSLGGALSMWGILSAIELGKLGLQYLKLSGVQTSRWQKELHEPLVLDFCCFWLGRDGWKKVPVVQKVTQVMIVRASTGGYVLDFEDLSFSCLWYNEVSSAVNSVRSFFGPADDSACSFTKTRWYSVVWKQNKISSDFRFGSVRVHGMGYPYAFVSSCMETTLVFSVQEKWLLGTLAWMS